MATTEAKQDFSIVDFYQDRYGARLFPLRPREQIGDSNCKKPFKEDWPNANFSRAELLKYWEEGHPIAWALGPGDLVIDVDAATPGRPEKKGLESLERLEKILSIKFEALGTIEVQSPSGGRHFYFTKPADLLIRKKVKELSGIEFLSQGQYVVIAGSPHWQGGNYHLEEFDIFGERKQRLPAPAGLLGMLKRDITEPTEATEAKRISIEHLEQALSALEVTDYRDHEDWFALMAAIHSATGGSREGLEAFITWSTKDPNYAGAAGEISDRWQTLKDRPGGRTLGTLLTQLRVAGADDLARAIEAANDFSPVDPADFAEPPPPRDMRKVFAEKIALGFLSDRFTWEGLRTLCYWKGSWFRWDGIAYSQTDQAAIKAQLVDWCSGRFCNHSPSKISAALEVMTGVCLHAGDDCPSWRDGFEVPEVLRQYRPESLVASRSGVFSIEAAHLDPIPTAPPTPALFSTHEIAVEVKTRAEAGAPSAWLKFLAETFPEDPEAADTLQEWFGYCLTGDTSQQKMLVLLGPPRSGKGTITRTLIELLGRSQVASPTTQAISGEFGLSPLVGKKLALIPDSRSDRIPAIALERILAITGEDRLDINQKGRDFLTNVKIGARLILASNEIPHFKDSSGAINSRLLILNAPVSKLGKVDHQLFDRDLAPELPAIFHWAVDGYQRLRARGQFIQPQSGEKLAEALADAASPIAKFVRDYCETGDGAFEVECSLLFELYRLDCRQAGRGVPSDSSFGLGLRAACPYAQKVRRRQPGGQRVYFWAGLKLSEDGQRLAADNCLSFPSGVGV